MTASGAGAYRFSRTQLFDNSIAFNCFVRLRFGVTAQMVSSAEELRLHNIEALVQASRQRVETARQIADDVGPESCLHKLAMATVFTLEDCHEALVRMHGDPAGLAPVK